MTVVSSQNAFMGAVVDTELAKVEMILRIVDARTGETVKSRNVVGSATGQVLGAVSSLRKQILDNAMEQVRKKIVYGNKA